MNSCDTIEMFYNIRTDLDKIKYAVHITKIIQDVTQEDENCYRILQLFLNTLYIISETEKNMDFILSVFKLKLLCMIGFKPRLNECTNCGKKENFIAFSIKDNGVKCNECKSLDKSAINISNSTWVALKYIAECPIKSLYNFNLKGESLKELELISKVYFNEKLEKEYKLEDFFHLGTVLF